LFRAASLFVGLIALVVAIGEVVYLTRNPFRWSLAGFIVGLLFMAYRSIAYASKSER
jgi:hypothetical protein